MVAPTSQRCAGSGPAQLDMSRLVEVRKETTSAGSQAERAAAAGGFANATVCSDHMISAEWDVSSGWAAPRLEPYGPIALLPTASVLHYATECFEGLKAYRGFDGRLRLFRAERNCRRMQASAARVGLPGFDESQLLAMMVRLVAVDGPRWLRQPGNFCYLRPTLIATDAQLGLVKPRRALLFVIMSYMARLDRPREGLRLVTSPEGTVRAWEGGFGHVKLGANYGPSLPAAVDANGHGFDQVLWLYGPDRLCTEAGPANFFVVLTVPGSSRRQLVTATLHDKLVLEGVTRASVLDLARERLGDELDVVERRLSVSELVAAHEEGRLVEAFVTGTAYFICAVSLVRHGGVDMKMGMGVRDVDGALPGGKYANQIKGWLSDILYGNVSHPWAFVVDEVGPVADTKEGPSVADGAALVAGS